MKKSIKLVNILLIAVMVLTMLINVVSATSAAPNPNTFTGDDSASVGGINSLGNQAITIISTVGSIAAVIVLVVLGLKYMMGSAEERADYKKTLLPYIIGAVLVFAASTIAGVIFGFANNISVQ